MANISLPQPGQKPWSLNPAITAINAESTDTANIVNNGRLSASNLNNTIEDIAEPIAEAAATPLMQTLARVNRFDAFGSARLGISNPLVQSRYIDQIETLEPWNNLSGVSFNAVQVQNNSLVAASNTAPQGAKKAISPGGDISFTAEFVVPGSDAFCGVGFASAGTEIKSGSTDAFLVGVNATKNPGYVRGTDIGGTGQAAIATDVTWNAGDRCVVTGAIKDGQVSLMVTHLPTGMSYTRSSGSLPTSAWAGGVGSILAYTGGALTGASGQIKPIAVAKPFTRNKTTSLGGSSISARDMRVYMSLGGDNRTLLISPQYDPQRGAPLAVYLHNSGGTALNSVQDTRIVPYVQALLDTGYNVIMADASGSAWGNDSSRGKYVAAYEWAKSIVTTTGVILTGQSMGAQVGWNLLARDEIPNVQAALFVAGVCSLQNLYNSAQYQGNINSAFNVTSFSAIPNSYKPELRKGYEFRGVPVMLVHSPEDATCDIGTAQSILSKIAPYAPEATLVTSTGGHMAAPQFAAAVSQGIPFLQKYAPVN